MIPLPGTQGRDAAFHSSRNIIYGLKEVRVIGRNMQRQTASEDALPCGQLTAIRHIYLALRANRVFKQQREVAAAKVEVFLSSHISQALAANGNLVSGPSDTLDDDSLYD